MGDWVLLTIGPSCKMWLALSTRPAVSLWRKELFGAAIFNAAGKGISMTRLQSKPARTSL